MSRRDPERISVSSSEARIDDRRAVVVQLGGDHWELNVWLLESEVGQLPGVREARWDDRSCLTLGISAGVPVHWTCDGGGLSILVGQDDESWQFGATVPEEQLDEICVAAVKALGRAGET